MSRRGGQWPECRQHCTADLSYRAKGQGQRGAVGRDVHCTSLRPGVEVELKERWKAELRQPASSDDLQHVCGLEPVPNQGLRG